MFRRVATAITLLVYITIIYPVTHELTIAAIFKNEGPYLQEWIEYHRTAGVGYFWLYNDASDDNWKEVLQPYIQEGILEVTDWHVPNRAHFIQRQVDAYKDALKKASGNSSWIALIDIDEFLLPHEEKTIPECLTKHFNLAAGIYVNWFHFGTSGVTLKPNESLLFHLTACARKHYPQNSIGKSIVRPDRVDIAKVWSGHHFVLKDGACYSNGDGQKILFKGVDLALDGKVHNKFIRLNHYYTRDENFFHNIRLPRALIIGIEEWLVWEHYRAFNKRHDRTIINFIRDKHPEAYKAYWEKKALHLSQKK